MKRKKYIVIAPILIIFLLLSVAGYFAYQNYQLKQQSDQIQDTSASTSKFPTSGAVEGSSALNSTYVLDDMSVTLVNGQAEEPIAEGSASVVVTQIMEDPITGDLTGAGTEDYAVIISQNTGGSGTFWYVSACMQVGVECQGTNGQLLGDRITLQGFQITDDNFVKVNYVDRPEGAAMTDEPSESMTKYFQVNDGVLVEASNPS